MARKMVSPVKGRVSSEYGRRAPISGVTTGTLHAGIDIAAPVGTPVYAAWGGKVIGVGSGLAPGRSGDRNVLIQNPDGECQYYGHLNAARVKVGQTVTGGQRIGDVGARGNVTGPHLHFETWKNSSANSHQNPRIYFDHWKIAPGSTPKAATPAKPKPPAGADGDTLRFQKRANQYFKAGLVEDGVNGSVTKAWRVWVGQAQTALNHFKSSKAKLIVDRDPGPVTAAYVGDVQKRNGLVVDRILGPVMVRWMRSKGSSLPNRPANRP